MLNTKFQSFVQPGMGADAALEALVKAAVELTSQEAPVSYTHLNNLEFYNVPLGAMLRTRLGLPVYVDTDANAAAWGEYRAGVGRGCSSMGMVTLGTGVGLSLIHI